MLRKISLFSLLLIVILSGCTNANPSLSIKLNPGIDTIEVNSEFIDAGARATLNHRKHSVSILKNDVDITKVGSYSITYQTTYENISKTITRYVDVVDQTPPMITLKPGIDTVVINNEWIDAGVSITDNSKLDVSIETFGKVIISSVGEYQIKYVATDEFGNQAEAFRFVNIISP